MADLLEGYDSEGGEDFCEDVYNLLKNHWRQSDPVANLSGQTAGMIVSDSDDDKLYHFGAGPAAEEVLQATRSIDIIPQFLGVDLWSSTYHHIIRASEAEGLAGADLRIALDNSLRTLIISDMDEIDRDYGHSAQANPILYIKSASGNVASSLTSSQFTLSNNALVLDDTTTIGRLRSTRPMYFIGTTDQAVDNMFTFESSAGIELTDTNGEQAWVYIEPKIRQTLTAGYVGILVDVTEESLGDASAGAGYNALMDLRVATVSQFRVENNGDTYVGGDFKTEAYIRRDTILWNDCFDHGVGATKYQWTWDRTSLNTQGNGSNTIDTTPSHITLTTDNNAIGDNEGSRTEFAIVLRSRKNRSEIVMELGQTVNTQFYFGWNTSGTNVMNPAADKYVIVFFDVSDNANWQIKVGNGAAEDVFTSAIAADTNEIIHEIWVETDGTVHWSVNGTELDITGSVTKVMQADDHYLIVGQAQSVTGAAAVVAEIDNIENEKYKSH